MSRKKSRRAGRISRARRQAEVTWGPEVSQVVRRHAPLLIPVVLAAAVGAAHLPALHGDFINLDDPQYVTQNPHIRSLSWDMVSWAFASREVGNWHPLTWVSLALDYRMHGLLPYGYHLTSLSLHIANSILVFLILRRLTGATWRSATVAALFGLHPLRVESVAWVAERKDVLCALFWLLTMAAYARYVRLATWMSYLIVVVSFAMALLSKPMAVTLPGALLLLDYWPLRRLSGRAVLEKAPLLVLAVAASAATFVAQKAGGALDVGHVPLPGRLANAVVAYARYLAFTVWPLHLSPWYSHPSLEGPPLSGWAVAGAAGLLVGLTTLAATVARRQPYAPVGWLFYLGTLLPVIGLVQVGGQAMADRYTYIPHIGLLLAIVWCAADLPIWTLRMTRAAWAVLVALLLTWSGVLTFRQTQIWHDTTSFWTYTVAANPRSFMGHQVLGDLSRSQGRFHEALDHYRRAARLRPGFADVHRALAHLLVHEGKVGAAAAQCRKVVQLTPESANDESLLADALLLQGRPMQARRHLERALVLRPDLAEAHNNLGRVLLSEGRLQEAVMEFRAAVQAKPDFAAARSNLAGALAQLEQTSPALSP